MTLRRVNLSVGSMSLIAALVTGCASKEPEPAAPAEASAGGEVPKSAAELAGSWVEFWALSGKAETQRYTFLGDGRFGWQAGPAGASPPALRFGRYDVQGAELVLHVQGEDVRADCTEAASCRTFHDPAIELRLPLGVCPENAEAKSVDQAYRCTAIGGQAFWHTDELRADNLAELAK